MNSQRYVIAGGGQAAANAATALRSEGFEGKIVIVGDESHLPYERPPLSKETLLEEEPLCPHVFPGNHWQELGVEIATDRAAEGIDLDAKCLEISGGVAIAYDKLLIATGGRPRRLNHLGEAGDGINYLRTFNDSLELCQSLRHRCRLLVIGAGVIGLEVASTAVKQSCRVTVVELDRQALGRILPESLSRSIERLHERRGVELRFQTSIQGLEYHDGQFRAVLNNNQEIVADAVVAGIGMQPNIELAADAGIDVAPYGVLVDQYGATSAPDVYAAGDVTAFWHPRLNRRIHLECWLNAQNQAIAVARNMAGSRIEYNEVPWMWTDQHDTNYQIAGIRSDGGETVETVARGDLNDGDYMVYEVQNGRITWAFACNRARDMTITRKLMERDIPVDPEVLADSSQPLRKLMKRR